MRHPKMADVKNLEELAHPEYWDQRYKKSVGDELFEWFKPFEAVEPLLSAHLPGKELRPRLLHLGCGNSVGFPFCCSLWIFLFSLTSNVV